MNITRTRWWLAKNRRGPAGTEGSLTAGPTERAGEIGRLAALKQDDDHQNEAVSITKKAVNSQPNHRKPTTMIAKPMKKSDDPLHPTWHFYLPTQSLETHARERLRVQACSADERAVQFSPRPSVPEYCPA